MIYQNFYIKAPIAMLDVPLQLVAFAKPIENTDVERYYTIVEYLAPMNQTIKRYTNDGEYWIKGFGFNISGLDELRLALPSYGLEENVTFFILSPAEVFDELAKPEWIANEIL